MNSKYYDLYYTVIKNRDVKEMMNKKTMKMKILVLEIFLLPIILLEEKMMMQCWGRENWDLRWFFSKNSYYLNRDAKMISRKCEICKIDVHRASFAKDLRGKNLWKWKRKWNDYTGLVI